MRCACGFDNPSDAKFCVACGRAVSQMPPGTVSTGAATAPARAPSVARRKKPPVSRRSIVLRSVAVLAVVFVAGFIYWWRTRPLGWYRQDSSGLYRVRQNGKFGFMERSGRMVIQPQFDDALSFSEGMAWVRVGKKVGFIDKAGKIVVTPQFDDAQSFVYGRAGVKLCCGGWGERHFGDRYGFIDSDGKYIGAPEFLWVGQFSGDRSGDLAPVQSPAGQFGFISRSGKIAIEPTFEDTSVLGFTGGTAPVRSKGKWGYIDHAGKWTTDPQFDSAWNFSDGLAAVAVSEKWGYIASDGKFAVNPQFDAALYFDGGYGPVRNGQNWTLIDHKGVPVANLSFSDVAAIPTEGLRAICTNDGWGYLQGPKVVIRPLFDSAEPFIGGLARVTVGDQQVYVDKIGAYAGEPFKGRSIRPAEAVQEVWEGDVTGPKWKSHEKFVLIRKGPKLKGYYSSSVIDPSALGNLSDVSGEIDQNDAVRLMSDSGFVWKGRFLAPVVISGTRPNGEEGNAPEFPFRLHYVRDATPDDKPVPLQATTSDWSSFLDQFKQAFDQKDQTALTKMIGWNFYLQNSRIRSTDDVFRQLNWPQLAKALADGVTIDRTSPLGRPVRSVTDEHPCNNCAYQVRLTFGSDADGQWRWTGVIYPGD
jgi:hypothetical protein